MDFVSAVKSVFHVDSSSVGRIYGLPGSSPAFFLALSAKPFVAVENDETAASVLASDINFYRGLLGIKPVLFLPEPDGAEACGTRARIIYGLTDEDSIVVSASTLVSAIPDRQALEKESLLISRGVSLDRDEFEELLVMLGYRKESMALEKGAYSRRGWITDVFPATMDKPVRVEFFGDEVERMRHYDIDSQRSEEDVESFMLFPAAEPSEPRKLSTVTGDRGYYSLFDPSETEGLPEGSVYLSRYSFEPGPQTEDSPLRDVDAGLASFGGFEILPEERKGIEMLARGVKTISESSMVLIVASSKGQAERLRELLYEGGVVAPIMDQHDLASDAGLVTITVGELSSGFYSVSLAVLTERELFGERPHFRAIRKSGTGKLLTSVDDITAGDFVVHRDYGVARFGGVVLDSTDETEQEMMLLEYENGRLRIPVQNIGVLSKYRSKEGVVPRIDSLGGKSWQKKKEKARRKIHEMAEKLLAVYAGRKTARGFSFTPDTELHREFGSFFAYEETPDQLRAISDIIRDMESERPMDRLLCGDVGYGKTEVAMRAAFKAVYDNRQVAVLVPTTILAEQHFRTFVERFSGFPVNIDFLSRFKSPADARTTLKKLAAGEIDIIIGTHSILSKKVVFNSLGLLIVDEEHRFGVGQKERIKEITCGVDVLNLSATPIPRTLHMALSGIRDISVIETPPIDRQAVRSTVSVYGEGLIRDALNAELRRNGRAYFVHNRIEDLYKVARRISELVPFARLGIAHGRMSEKELEDVMHKFFRGEIDILVCTAIIGSGLDVPSANTIIIDMADRMGLADLYQVRGRVGRSSVKGYAYFLAPPEDSLTDEAKKRLQAIQEMSYLGAGFRLALKDLEIRGAGDIFGAEQSGHINEIGFDLYMEMLENAVSEMKGLPVQQEREPSVDMKLSALIPESYIEDTGLRLGFYRRISGIRTAEALTELQEELEDRFGPLPPETVSLLEIVKLRMTARELMIFRIAETAGKVVVSFYPDTCVMPEEIFGLQQGLKGAIRFIPDGFELQLKNSGGKSAVGYVHEILMTLAEPKRMNAAAQ